MKIWNELIQLRSENQDLSQRIRTCASMIVACLNSESSDKEKRELTNRLVRVSSEIGDYRRSADAISEEARLYIAQFGEKRRNGIVRIPKELKKDLMHEHLVPCAFLSQTIFSSRPSREEIHKLLIEYGIRCIVLKEEDDKINAAKLNKSMPENWQLGHDPFLRYQLAGINNFTVKERHIHP
ncbi:hypothetical protein A9Q83_01400 [Alphaproteobacteria bacterium 46_93_T64]|nr:hypothetical protein A9Q83_01400 [Alphaproteobacteria bacterium 46_93_T64]